MNYKDLDLNFNPYIQKIKSFNEYESNEFTTYIKEAKEASLNVYTVIFNIVSKKKEDDSNLIEKIKILNPQIVELNKVLKDLHSTIKNTDLIEDILGVSIPLEETIENLLKK